MNHGADGRASAQLNSELLVRFSAVDREERSLVDMNGVIERAVHWVKKGTAPAFDVHWQPGAEAPVMGSAGQLLQVLMNLVQNAYDAASQRPGALPALWIACEAADGWVRVSLRDSGPGIAEADLTRIFAPFSPPSRWARARAWACPSPTASWSNMAAACARPTTRKAGRCSRGSCRRLEGSAAPRLAAALKKGLTCPRSSAHRRLRA